MAAVNVPRGALARDLAKQLKQKCPRIFRGVSAARIMLHGARERGRFIRSDSFELGLLPELMAAGEFLEAEAILSDWLELNANEAIDRQLPDDGGGAVIHIVAVVPTRKIVCLANNTVFKISLSESATISELKDKIKNIMPGWIKLVTANDENQQLTRDDVKARRSSQVARFVRVLAAKDEIDLSRTVRAVFGTATSRGSIDVVVVPCEAVLDSRYLLQAKGGSTAAGRSG